MQLNKGEIIKDGDNYFSVFCVMCSVIYVDIVNITLHFFLKDARPMLPLVMKHNTAVA